MPELTHQLVMENHDRYGIWWHNGSSQVSAQLLACAGMPRPDAYLGLMMDVDQQFLGDDQFGPGDALPGLSGDSLDDDGDPLGLDDEPSSKHLPPKSTTHSRTMAACSDWKTTHSMMTAACLVWTMTRSKSVQARLIWMTTRSKTRSMTINQNQPKFNTWISFCRSKGSLI